MIDGDRPRRRAREGLGARPHRDGHRDQQQRHGKHALAQLHAKPLVASSMRHRRASSISGDATRHCLRAAEDCHVTMARCLRRAGEAADGGCVATRPLLICAVTAASAASMGRTTSRRRRDAFAALGSAFATAAACVRP